MSDASHLHPSQLNDILCEPGVLTVGVDEAPPPPLNFGVPGSPTFGGFEVDLTQALAEWLGLAIRYRSALWSEILAEVMARQLDLICGAATITAERRQVVEFSEPYLDTELVLIVGAESPVRTLADLRGRTVGVRLGTVAEDFLRQQVQPVHVQTFHMNTEQYQALQAQQVEAVIDDRPMGDFFVRSLPGLQVVTALAGTQAQYGMVLAKGNERLREVVNQGLHALKAEGTWGRFYRKWFEERTAPGEAHC